MDSTNKYISRFYCSYEYLCQLLHCMADCTLYKWQQNCRPTRYDTMRYNIEIAPNKLRNTTQNGYLLAEREYHLRTWPLTSSNHNSQSIPKDAYMEYCRWLRTIGVSRVSLECRMKAKKKENIIIATGKLLPESLEQPKSTVDNRLFR